MMKHHLQTANIKYTELDAEKDPEGMAYAAYFGIQSLPAVIMDEELMPYETYADAVSQIKERMR